MRQIALYINLLNIYLYKNTLNSIEKSRLGLKNRRKLIFLVAYILNLCYIVK
jgi:hypothetical protein